MQTPALQLEAASADSVALCTVCICMAHLNFIHKFMNSCICVVGFRLCSHTVQGQPCGNAYTMCKGTRVQAVYRHV